MSKSNNSGEKRKPKAPVLDATDAEAGECYQFLASGRPQITINSLVQAARSLGQDLSTEEALNMLEYALTHCPESMERGSLDIDGFKSLMEHFNSKQPAGPARKK